jgi:mannose/fructose/N-acetylgalactosamine-specific phosphotransferase system component IID
MISIGISFSLIPVASRLFPDKIKRREFLERHLSFFNAHPYFTSFALGAITRVEQDLAADGEEDYSRVQRLKNALMGPLGAIGDELVWATIKPASILVALLGVLLIDNFYWKIVFLFILLVLYNIPHLYIRIYGLKKGYQLGFDVYKLLNIEKYKTVRNIYGGLGALAIGVVFTYSILQSGSIRISYAIVFALSFLSAYFYKKWHFSVYRSLTLPIILAVILGLVIENI